MEKAYLKNNQVAKFNDETKKVIISGNCTCTGELCSVTISYEDYLHYYIEHMHIQDAMPTITPDDRKFLMSGVSPKGWEELFSTNE